jgi:hypothetical protein
MEAVGREPRRGFACCSVKVDATAIMFVQMRDASTTSTLEHSFKKAQEPVHVHTFGNDHLEEILVWIQDPRK